MTRQKERDVDSMIPSAETGFFFSLNILKLFLAVSIVFFHVTVGREASNAYLGVDLFFMITGFLMWEHRETYLSRSFIKSIFKRLGSFYFYYLFLIIFCVGLILGQEIKFRPTDLIATAFFLNFDLVDKIVPNALWFLTVYVWVFAGYLGVMKVLSRRGLFLVVTGIITLSGMIELGTVSQMRGTREIYLGMPIGFLRGIVGTGLGILVASLSQRLNKKPSRVVADICLTVAVGAICYIFFYVGRDAMVQIPFYVVGAVTLFMLSFKQGYMCKALEWGGAKVPVLWALFIPIYIYHTIVMTVLTARQGQNPVTVLGITMALSLVLFYVNRFLIMTRQAGVVMTNAKRVKKSK